MKTPIAHIGQIFSLAGFLALALPALAALPDFDAMLKGFPAGEPAEVKKRIGGGVNADWITNVSAIRISAALNAAGQPIPAGPAGSVAGLHTVRGGDKANYAYRIAEMNAYILSKYGPPTVSLKAGPYGSAPAILKGKRGIIQFVDCGWSDAAGHLDLWDGSKVVGKGYFEICKQIVLWDAKAGVAAAKKTGKLTAATNIRSGPSTSAPVVGQLAKDAIVTITGPVQSNFYPIGNGQYVTASYVKLLD